MTQLSLITKELHLHASQSNFASPLCLCFRGQLKIHFWKMRGCREVAMQWKGEEGTEDFFSVRSDTHHWWVWVLAFSVSVGPFKIWGNSLSFGFIYKSSQIQIRFAIKTIVENATPHRISAAYERGARTLNNITKQFSRLSRRRNIHTRPALQILYIRDPALATGLLRTCFVCVREVMVGDCNNQCRYASFAASATLFMKWNVVPLVRCN